MGELQPLLPVEEENRAWPLPRGWDPLTQSLGVSKDRTGKRPSSHSGQTAPRSLGAWPCGGLLIWNLLETGQEFSPMDVTPSGGAPPALQRVDDYLTSLSAQRSSLSLWSPSRQRQGKVTAGHVVTEGSSHPNHLARDTNNVTTNASLRLKAIPFGLPGP